MNSKAPFKIRRATLLRIRAGDKILVHPAWSYEGWVTVTSVDELTDGKLWFNVEAPPRQNIASVPEGEVLGHQAVV